jgi:hypothetical protein
LIQFFIDSKGFEKPNQMKVQTLQANNVAQGVGFQFPRTK